MLKNLLPIVDTGQLLLQAGILITMVRLAARWLDRRSPGRSVVAWIAGSAALKSIGFAAYVASFTILGVLHALTNQLGDLLFKYGGYAFIVGLACLVCWLLDQARKSGKGSTR